MDKIRISKLNDVLKIPGYNRGAFVTSSSYGYLGLSKQMKFVFVMYQNTNRCTDSLIEIRYILENNPSLDASKPIPKDILVNILSGTKYLDDLVEVQGRMLIKDYNVKEGIHPSIDLIYSTGICSFFLKNKYPIVNMICFPDKIKSLDDGLEVECILKKVREFKYEMSEDGSIRSEILDCESSINWSKKRISECDFSLANTYKHKEEAIKVLAEYGLDKKLKEIV